MMTRCQALLAVAALAVAGRLLAGGQPDWDDTAFGPHDDMRSEASMLLRSDSRRIASLQKVPESAYVPPVPTAGTVVMSPYILREPVDRDVAMPKYETPAMRFLRDGTLYKHIGRKYSTEVLLRFYQSKAPSLANIPPAQGIQLAVTLAW